MKGYILFIILLVLLNAYLIFHRVSQYEKLNNWLKECRKYGGIATQTEETLTHRKFECAVICSSSCK